MKITIGMLLYLLSLDTAIYTNISRQAEYTIDGFEIWDGEFPKKNMLYLITQEDLKKDPDLWYRRTVLLRGKPDAAALEEKHVDWIFVTEHLSEVQIQQKVYQNMKLVYNWYMELQKYLLQRKSLEEILNMTEQFLQIGGSVFTREMVMKGISDDFSQRNDWVDEENGISANMVNELLTDEDFQKAENHTHAFLFCNSQQEWFCCFNLFAENVYDARLIMSAGKQEVDYGLLQFVQIMGEAINSVYEELYYQKDQTSTWEDLIEMAEHMLHGTGVPYNEQKTLLARFQWRINDTYQIVLFRFQEGAGAGIGMKYFQEQMLRLFRECCVITEPMQFICIRNISRSDAAHDFADTLPYFLRDSLCKAGLSDVFREFSNLPYYYREAEYALSTGETIDNSRWYHQFSRYAFEYLVEHSTTQLLPLQGCHQALKILRRYDQANDTELFVTLDTFLQKRQNITHTADALNIHRTTLLARIDRIQTLTRVDLDEYATCLHLMLSYEIWKRAVK